MTISEFLHPLYNQSIKIQCLGVLYYEKIYNKIEAIELGQLKDDLKQAGMRKSAKSNLSAILSQAAPYIQGIGVADKNIIWQITSTGEKKIRELLALPEVDIAVAHDVSSLKKLALSIPDILIADFLKEGINCLSIGALRASVVLLWTGAVRFIQDDIMANKLTQVNNSLLKFDSKSRPVKKIDDLSYIKESVLLLMAQDLGIFDKNQRETLEECLKLRNKCGHPGKYSPGPQKVRSFIEDITNIVLSKI